MSVSNKKPTGNKYPSVQTTSICRLWSCSEHPIAPGLGRWGFLILVRHEKSQVWFYDTQQKGDLMKKKTNEFSGFLEAIDTLTNRIRRLEAKIFSQDASPGRQSAHEKCAIQRLLERVLHANKQAIDILSCEKSRESPELRATLYDNLTAISAEAAEVAEALDAARESICSQGCKPD